MSQKELTDSPALRRFEKSSAEDLLTQAFSAAEIIETIRGLGGDPEQMGQRARTLIAGLREARDPALGHHLPVSSQSWMEGSNQNQNAMETKMKKDFEFRQLLRAYRSGLINESTFETEMKHLEMGAPNGSNGGGFTAFGRTYASERDAVIKFLETVAPAETAGGEAIRAWLQVCKLDCIKGGLKMVAEREAYHGRAFAQRLTELGGTVPQRTNPEISANIDYLRDSSISDLEKLHKGATRFPNPDETIRPLFEFAELLKEDQQTKEMVKLFAQDELSTLKWQNGLCAVLTEMKNNGQLAATA